MSRKPLPQQTEELFALARKETDPAIKQALIDGALYILKIEADGQHLAIRMERNMTDLRMARIEPWGADLNPDDITRHTNDVDDILAKDILDDLEKRGISHVRITAQSPDQYVIRAFSKAIGPLHNHRMILTVMSS